MAGAGGGPCLLRISPQEVDAVPLAVNWPPGPRHQDHRGVRCRGRGDPRRVQALEGALSRDRVDILIAAIDDLGAKGGVIFTTKGYEAGAEAFAKSKGIELFVVRDLTDAEWGLPGRSAWFYMHIYAAKIEDLASKAELRARVRRARIDAESSLSRT